MAGSDSSGDRDPVERLAEEFIERHRRGEPAPMSEYVERFPEWADHIREVFPALLVMERLKPRPDEETGSFDREGSGLGSPRLERLGDYRILREIGRGGMGVVYEAVQESLGRHVALKILPIHGRISATQMERFRLEARSAARLHHTHIVPVYGVGEHDGVPYYAMQYISGHGLDAVLEDVRRLRDGGIAAGDAVGIPDEGSVAVARSLLTGRFGATLPETSEGVAPAPARINDATPGEGNGAPSVPVRPRSARRSTTSPGGGSVLSHPTVSGYHRAVARLGLEVAEALAHAHQQGVLHRDIKPSNLLLDVDGHVWVTDFGLAKLEGSEGLTETGDVVGTLRYMAPERFEGWSDRRSDVYGLGMTLYELLTLRPAFDAVTRAKLIDQVIHDPAPPPRRHDWRIPRDLETIVLKAIAKEPGERYATAEALASDLKNFLQDRPIVARRTGPAERVVKWAKRRPAIAALVGLLNVVAALGFLGILWQWRQTVEANRSLDQANTRLDDTNKSLERNGYYTTIRLANSELDNQNFGHVQKLLVSCPERLRDWEYDFLGRACHSEFQEIAGLFTNQVFGIAFSPDPEGRRIATASMNDGVMVWDAVTRELLLRPSGLERLVVSVAFSPDGKWLAAGVCESERPGAIWIGSAETGIEERTIKAHFGIIWSVAFSPDGKHLASAGEDKTVRIWDTETGALIETPAQGEAQEFTSVAFSPNGRYLAAATGTRKEQYPENISGEVRIWDAWTWKEVRRLKGHRGSVNCVDFSPDDRWLASASSDRAVKIWDLETGHEINTLRGHTGYVVGVAFKPDGKQIVSASEDSTLRIWDTGTGEALVILHGHAGMVNCVAYSPDGKRIASVSDDLTAKIWDADQPPVARILGGSGCKWFTDVTFDTNGKSLAAANGDRTVTIWDQGSYQKRQVLQEYGDPIWGVAFSRNGLIAFACGDVFRSEQTCQVRVRDWKTGQLVKSLPMGVNVAWSVAFSPDGRWLAAGGGIFGKETVELKVWDTSTWEVRHELKGHTSGVSCVAFSPDGRSLVSATNNDGTIKVWDVETGAWLKDLKGTEISINSVAFSPDGKSLATGGSESVTIWDLATSKKSQVFPGHLGDVKGVAYHPDGKRLASAGRDGTVKVWDVQTGQEVLTLRGHDGPVCDLAFSPDGLQLVSAGRDGTVRIWDGTPWRSPPDAAVVRAGIRSGREEAAKR